MCDPADLAAFRGAGYVVAPAGYGKTHLIASATGLSGGRQLVLTHTYAGVSSLKRKMQFLGVNPRLYRIDTIASWSLRLCLAYRSTSGWVSERPTDEEWDALYGTCSAMLDHEFVRRILRASYTGVFVDEYQDCSTAQHEIVLRMARDLPARILGDPLQGIFDFEGQDPIDWVRDVEGSFEHLGTLEIPYRWRNVGSDDLAEWLRFARGQLEQGLPLDLRVRRPRCVSIVRNQGLPHFLPAGQANACRRVDAAPDHTVVAIHQGSQEYRSRCHTLSRQLGGMFSSIEEVEGKAVFAFLRSIQEARRADTRLRRAVDFAKSCLTGVTDAVPATVVRGEQTAIRANTRNPDVARLANAYLEDGSSAALAAFLKELRRSAGVSLIRSDLFNRVLGVLRTHVLHPGLTLQEAGERYQSEFRHKGRPVGHRRIIGTTLLLKGLEYDHAVVLEATSLSRKNLYVALTRGSRTLTIVTADMVLDPQH